MNLKGSYVPFGSAERMTPQKKSYPSDFEGCTRAKRVNMDV